MNIKFLLFFFLLWLVCSSSTCKKEGENCHYYIHINNNSQETVVGAIVVKGFSQPVPDENTESGCRFSGTEIASGTNHKFRPYNNCIEDEMDENDIQNYYIVDVNSYSQNNILFPCDSIESNHTILRKYSLSLNNLKSINFTINYP